MVQPRRGAVQRVGANEIAFHALRRVRGGRRGRSAPARAARAPARARCDSRIRARCRARSPRAPRAPRSAWPKRRGRSLEGAARLPGSRSPTRTTARTRTSRARELATRATQSIGSGRPAGRHRGVILFTGSSIVDSSRRRRRNNVAPRAGGARGYRVVAPSQRNGLAHAHSRRRRTRIRRTAARRRVRPRDAHDRLRPRRVQDRQFSPPSRIRPARSRASSSKLATHLTRDFGPGRARRGRLHRRRGADADRRRAPARLFAADRSEQGGGQAHEARRDRRLRVHRLPGRDRGSLHSGARAGLGHEVEAGLPRRATRPSGSTPATRSTR